MSSILTNNSALTALQSLRLTQQSLMDTQKQISTGLKVSSAADNASSWSIAETMKSDNGVLSTISDSLSQSTSLLSAATAGVNSILSTLNSIKQAVSQAQNPTADTTKILTAVQALGQNLISTVAGAQVNGVNVLSGTVNGVAPTGNALNLVAYYNDGGGAAASTVGTISIDLSAPLLGLGATPTTGSLATAQATGSAAATNFTAMVATDLTTNVADTLSNVDKAIADVTTYASSIGAAQTRVTSQSTFISALSTALTTGVSSLVDADMNQASTRLQALQTQQQLGVQSLSIANQNAQMILKLFQ
jgi:flagellin